MHIFFPVVDGALSLTSAFQPHRSSSLLMLLCAHAQRKLPLKFLFLWHVATKDFGFMEHKEPQFLGEKNLIVCNIFAP